MLCIVGAAVLGSAIYLFVMNHVVCAWDEAVYAHNAFNMSENKEGLRYFFFNEANQYNSKPPLVIWLQTCCIWLFGNHEFALRIPSMLALGLLFVVFYRWMRLMNMSLLLLPLVSLTTLSIPGLIRAHVFLTGDLDGMLVLITSAIQCYALYSFSIDKLPKHFFRNLFFLFLLGYFTKSTAVFLILPALLVFAIGYKKVILILTDKRLYFYTLIFVLLIAGYYFLREQQDPGHFKVVFHSEFLRVYEKVMHWHVQPFSFYFDIIYDRENTYGFYLSVLLLIPFFSFSSTKYKKVVVLLFVAILANLLFISMPPVKLEWYPAPIYPMWALMNAVMLLSLIEAFIQKRNGVITTLLITAWIIPLWFSYQSLVTRTKQLDPVEMEAHVMKKIPHHYKQYTVLKKPEHDEVAYVYTRWINPNRANIKLKHALKELRSGEWVLVCDQTFKDSLQNHSKILWQQPEGVLVQLD